MEQRYEAYKDVVVRPFFRTHFARLDRQAVLVDVLAALNGGPAAVADLEAALAEILACFRPGRSSWLSGVLSRRIDRILFAATKADHLHHTSHDRLEGDPVAHDRHRRRPRSFAGADVDVRAIAAVRATREAMVRRNGDTLPSIIGIPQPGERLDGDVFDGETEIALFPGDLPERPETVFEAVQASIPDDGSAGSSGRTRPRRAGAAAGSRRRRRRPPPSSLTCGSCGSVRPGSRRRGGVDTVATAHPPGPCTRLPDRRQTGMTGNGRKPAASASATPTSRWCRTVARPHRSGCGDRARTELETAVPLPKPRRGFRWGRVFWASLSGLVAFAIGLMVDQLIRDLFARNDWLGWTGLALAVVAGVAALAMILREIVGLIRLARIDRLRERAEAASLADDEAAAGTSFGIW